MNQRSFDTWTAAILLTLVSILILSVIVLGLVEQSASSAIAGRDVKASLASWALPQDIDAQRSMAFAAWAMFLVAILQMIIAVLGVWFVRATLEETRKSVQTSTFSATAAQVSAQATVDSLALVKKLSDDEHRPWLSISRIEILTINRRLEDYEIACSLEVHNHGQSPALDVMPELKMELDFRDLRGMVVRAAAEAKEKLSHGNAIFPGVSRTFEISIYVTCADVDKAKRNLALGVPILLVSIGYRSARSGLTHQTTDAFFMTRDGEKIADEMVAINSLMSAFQTQAD